MTLPSSSGSRPCVRASAVNSPGLRSHRKMTSPRRAHVVAFLILAFLTIGSYSIKCYQCSSDTDPEGEDNCGAYTKFDKERNVPVECNSDESKMPGTFCVKLTQQSPRGFIWDGRWRQVIRRCASVSSTGVTGVCNWGVYENGVYWQECSCSEDSCNSATMPGVGQLTTLLLIVAAPLALCLR